MHTLHFYHTQKQVTFFHMIAEIGNVTDGTEGQTDMKVEIVTGSPCLSRIFGETENRDKQNS